MTLLQTDFLGAKSETFQALRYLLQDMGILDGVVGSPDFLVTQRGAGANMSVDVAAGGAFIRASTVARQGIYHQVNDNPINVLVPTSDLTNPRIDSLYLGINDSTISGASDTPQLIYQAGTPTPGATLDNRNGAQDNGYPLSWLTNGIRQADILVPAGSSSVVNTNIRDRRLFSYGINRKVLLTSGNQTIVSTTYVDLGAGMQPRVEMHSNTVLRALLSGRVFSPSGGTGAFSPSLNGSVVEGATDIFGIILGGSSQEAPMSVEWPIATGNGGTSKVYPVFRSTTGAGMVVLGTVANPLGWYLREEPPQNANNSITSG